MKNTINITAVITDPEGKELFRSEHMQSVPFNANPKTFFYEIIPPIERTLSDVHKKFCPTPEEIAASEANPE